LIEAITNNHPIVIVEGEAKADLLWSWNIAATCCVAGAKKWKAEHSEFLRGADVFLLPDNDNPGWEHINKVGESLSTIAKSIRVVTLPGLASKGDIVDWAKAGGTREQLDALLGDAQDWQPPIADSQNEDKDEAKRAEDELIENLATMKGLDFARERKRLADELRVSAAPTLMPRSRLIARRQRRSMDIGS
jgi:DNA primase